MSAPNCAQIPTNCSACFEKAYCIKFPDHPSCTSMPTALTDFCANTCRQYVSCDEAKAQFVKTPPDS